jgi:hypothetical protein
MIGKCIAGILLAGFVFGVGSALIVTVKDFKTSTHRSINSMMCVYGTHCL